MQDRILRRLFMGFMQIHILHHGIKEPFYGVWMIEELRSHGYDISPGTLYPMLHEMESGDLLQRVDRTVEGKVRKYYHTTEKGKAILIEARGKLKEMSGEIG